MELCMYEGYLRNRRELCNALSLEPIGTRSEIERQILLEGWRRWGRSLLQRLYGSFAFAIMDTERQELICARDPFGLMGFYYYVTADGRLLYGEDLSGIVNSPGFHREIDPEALQQYMEFGYPVGERTLYRGVKRLLPGRCLHFRRGVCLTERWFKPIFRIEENVSEEQWIEEIDRTIREILAEDRGCFDPECCCAFLSGGVDSSFLLAVSGVKNAATVCFGDAGFNENRDAAATARHLGAGLREVRISPEDYFSSLPQFVRSTELPLADTASAAFALACERVSGEKMAYLSGEGADEFFAGYHVYARAEELSKRGGAWYFGCDGVLEPEEARRLLRQEICYPRDALVEGICDGDALNHMLEVDIALWLEGDILFGVRRAARSYGMDLLLPFSDPRMFALSARIPSALKRKGDCGKYILRRTAAAYLPEETAFRRKAGFPVPVREWMRQKPWRGDVEKRLFGASSEVFFDQELMRQYWDAYCGGGYTEFRVVYAAYVFLVWYETVFLETAPSS